MPTPTNTTEPTSTPMSTPTPEPAGVANAGVNLRAGPGTNYAKVGGLAQGDRVQVEGATEDGSWYRVRFDSGDPCWVAASFVDLGCEPDAVPTIGPRDIPPTPQLVASTATPTPTPGPTNTPRPAQAKVIIRYVFYNGEKGSTEPDEFAEIANTGDAPQNLKGWRLNAGNPGQDFTFPDFVLQSGQSCRVYTNERHPESGGFCVGCNKAIWLNKGDCGYLYDASGAEVSRYCY